MSRPAGYFTTSGERVPGVTTVLGRFKECGGLLHWAWEQGRDGKDYRDTRDAAAGAGTIAHGMIEEHITGNVPAIPLEILKREDAPQLKELAAKAFTGYLQWSSNYELAMTATELPLVSDVGRFGGTIDGVGLVKGRRALIDWKTSNRIYPEYIIQIAAYRELWDEAHPDDPIQEAHLLRVGKEFGEFAHFSWPLEVLEEGAEAFFLMRELYDRMKVLKRAVG